MKKEVFCLVECRVCATKTEMVIRNKDINALLDDNDIKQIVYDKSQKPYELEHCSTCDVFSIHNILGWKGLE